MQRQQQLHHHSRHSCLTTVTHFRKKYREGGFWLKERKWSFNTTTYVKCFALTERANNAFVEKERNELQRELRRNGLEDSKKTTPELCCPYQMRKNCSFKPNMKLGAQNVGNKEEDWKKTTQPVYYPDQRSKNSFFKPNTENLELRWQKKKALEEQQLYVTFYHNWCPLFWITSCKVIEKLRRAKGASETKETRRKRMRGGNKREGARDRRAQRRARRDKEAKR